MNGIDIAGKRLVMILGFLGGGTAALSASCSKPASVVLVVVVVVLVVAAEVLPERKFRSTCGCYTTKVVLVDVLVVVELEVVEVSSRPRRMPNACPKKLRGAAAECHSMLLATVSRMSRQPNMACLSESPQSHSGSLSEIGPGCVRSEPLPSP